MHDYETQKYKTAGMPPGSHVFIGAKRVENIKAAYIKFNHNDFEEGEIKDYTKCSELLEDGSICWIHVTGLHDEKAISEIGACFNINNMILEDILNTLNHPKIEFFDDFIFFEMKIVNYIRNSTKLQSEQLSVLLGQNFLLTFQETDIDHFSIIRERIKNSKSRFINHGSDYLCHSVIDLVVDKYFLLLETFSNSVEVLEDNLITNRIDNVLQKIHLLKRDLIYLSKTVKPAREVIRKFETEASVLLDKANTIYIRDVYDHIVQINDNIESFRETLTVMLDIYISGQGNKLNEIMKILTIISTIFIPLTFLAGVYGMNFQHMPELSWIYSYPLLWILMIAISLFMIFYFKRKKWF